MPRLESARRHTPGQEDTFLDTFDESSPEAVLTDTDDVIVIAEKGDCNPDAPTLKVSFKSLQQSNGDLTDEGPRRHTTVSLPGWSFRPERDVEKSLNSNPTRTI